MTTPHEREQWKVLLDPLPDGQLKKIAQSVDQKAPVDRLSKDDLIQVIVRKTTTSEKLLRRKYITREILILYSERMRLGVALGSKPEIIKSILEYWKLPGTTTRVESRLKEYEGKECEKILGILSTDVLRKYWCELYPSRSSEEPSDAKMIRGVLRLMPEVRWLLSRRDVKVEVLTEYLRREHDYVYGNPSKPELIERVAQHIARKKH